MSGLCKRTCFGQKSMFSDTERMCVNGDNDDNTVYKNSQNSENESMRKDSVVDVVCSSFQSSTPFNFNYTVQ